MQTFEKSSSPKLRDRILRYCTQIVFGYVLLKFVQNGGSTYIISEIIAKNNLNIVNLMETFENLLLQNYWIEFLDTSHK